MSRTNHREDNNLSCQQSEQERVGNLNFGTTYVSGDARPILGSVGSVVNHIHYHGPGASAETKGDDRNTRHQLSRTTTIVDPDAVSEYKALYEHWLRKQQRLAGTCRWLFETTEYQGWLHHSNSPILTCTGSVGSGKSILASAVVDQLICPQDPNHLVLSFYVDSLRDGLITTTEILRALIKQFIHHYKDFSRQIPDHLRIKLKEAFPHGQRFLVIPQAVQCVQAFIQDIGTSFFVIDGIDAMPENEISQLLQFIRSTFCKTDCNISHKLIVFCRDTLGRGIRLERLADNKILQINIAHLRDDIYRYVDHEVDTRQSDRPITSNTELINELKHVLKEHSSKMFLWIRLQLNSLWDRSLVTCDDHIKQQLYSLPEGLDETYLRCLQRIENTNDKRSKEFAPKAFKWVASAKEPLTQSQIQEAVSIDPDNWPLTRSMILQSPIQDYCANLLVLDSSTGAIAFPHASVKDFLSDTNKIPPFLHRYRLSPSEDDLWCGTLCLSYTSFLQSQKQVVQYHSQKITVDVVAPVLSTVSAGWLPKLWPKAGKPNSSQLKMPLRPRRSNVAEANLHLHGYLCKHWLTHTRNIAENHIAYPMFQNITHSHDADIQPWTDDSIFGEVHYQKCFEYAVMTNHPSLLRSTIQALQSKKNSYEKFLRGPCPGTNSSWLHVCAALDHWAVTSELAPFCDVRIANDQGQSAAAVAVENGHNKTFTRLMNYYNSRLMNDYRLTTFDGNQSGNTENLLRICASCGNTEALLTVLQLVRASAAFKELLSEAFFHAAYYGHEETGSFLIDMGASLKELSMPSGSRDYFKHTFEVHTLAGKKPLDTAMKIGSIKFFETLLKIGANLTSRNLSAFSDGDCDTIDVVNYFDGRHRAAETFLAALIRHGRLINVSREKNISANWLKEVFVPQPHQPKNSRYRNRCLEYMLSCPELKTIVRHQTAASRNMLKTDSAAPGVQVFPITKSIKGLEIPFFPGLEWVRDVSDKLFIDVLEIRWIDAVHLLSEWGLEVLATRNTSRALHAIFRWFYCDEVLAYQKSDMTRQSITFHDYLGFHACSSLSCRRIIRQATMSCRPTAHATRESTKSLDHALIWGGYAKHVAESHVRRSHGIITRMFDAAILADREDTLQVMWYYYSNFRQDEVSISTAQRNDILNRLRNTPKHIPVNAGYGTSAIAWLRCCSLRGSNSAATLAISGQLINVNSDANFSLNFPFGYQEAPKGKGGYIVDERIIGAMYGWAYRNNRKAGKTWSKADKWYLGWRFTLALKERQLTRKVQNRALQQGQLRPDDLRLLQLDRPWQLLKERMRAAKEVVRVQEDT